MPKPYTQRRKKRKDRPLNKKAKVMVGSTKARRN